MRIVLYNVGKTESGYLQQGIAEYMKRLQHYVDFSMVDIPNVKKKSNAPPELIKKLEGEAILKATAKANCIVLLDDKGKSFTSTQYANWLNDILTRGYKEVAFVSGGAWGFSEKVYQVAATKLSLSKMTFTHQMARLIFTEQLYRAFTIIKGMPYHNE